jgi:hypothetical protein
VRYIFLDTNNWIYLSNGFNTQSNKHDELHFKIFDLFRKRVNDGSITVLVNQLVLEEWKKNKQHCKNQVDELIRTHQGYRNTIKSIGRLTGEETTVAIDLIIKQLDVFYQAKVARHEKHILDVEQFLLGQTVLIDIPDSIKILAANMAAEKKAPFIGDKKNSMADALILLSSLRYVETNCGFKPFVPASLTTMYLESYFVSSNSGDFSSKKDKEAIHEDLKPLLAKTETQFYNSLSKLIMSLEAEFLSEEEASMMDLHNADCPVCHFPYARSVEFFQPYQLYDPNKAHKINSQQFKFNFTESEPKNDQADVQVEIIEGTCTQCNEHFFICPNCKEMNHIMRHNTIFQCEFECGYYYILNTDVDKKGMIHGWSLEIVEGKTCQRCEQRFTKLSDSGLCEFCEDHYGREN